MSLFCLPLSASSSQWWILQKLLHIPTLWSCFHACDTGGSTAAFEALLRQLYGEDAVEKVRKKGIRPDRLTGTHYRELGIIMVVQTQDITVITMPVSPTYQSIPHAPCFIDLEGVCDNVLWQ